MKLYHENMTINDAKMNQKEFNSKIDTLNERIPRNSDYIKKKDKLLNNAKNFYNEREKIIEGFEKGIFPLKSEQQPCEKLTDVNAFSKWINREETDIDRELFKNHFKFQRPSDMYKNLYEINDRKENNKLVNVIRSGLKDLKKEIKEMSKEEREIETPDKIVEIVKEILNFNKQNQKGYGLKILTPNQMLSILPISSAQLKAGNNSEKLKNEIRQLLYSLHRSKKLTKEIYKSLVDV